MRSFLCILIAAFLLRPLAAQEGSPGRMLIFGSNGGIGASYTDRQILFNLQGSVTMDYVLKNTWSVQMAPKYTWLIKWNEHYLTLPVHLRKKIGDRFSFYAGPALTFDIGYFKDIGLSSGIYFHYSERSAINLSAFTFTLYDYHIDYLFIPVGLTYNYYF